MSGLAVAVAILAVVVAVTTSLLWRARRALGQAEARANRERELVRGMARRWEEFEVIVERHRRAGTWPDPMPHARAQVDREEREARGAELSRALTERMARGMGEIIERTFGPWA